MMLNNHTLVYLLILFFNGYCLAAVHQNVPKLLIEVIVGVFIFILFSHVSLEMLCLSYCY